jgi:hypothetical protein
MWIKARRIPGNKQGTAGHGARQWKNSAVDTAPGGFPNVVWLRMTVRFYQAGEQDLGESDGSFHWAYPRNGGFTWIIMIIYGFIWFCLQITAIAMVKDLWNDDDQPEDMFSPC